MDLTRERLEKLLKEAKEAHALYEQKTGRPDADWPRWYAEFIMSKLQETPRDPSRTA